jgi:hypothetical protein
MYLASIGLFGVYLMKLFKGVSEYDKTNYIIVPIGYDEKNDKVVYLRIPQDDAGRFIGGLFWKMINFTNTKKDPIKNTKDLLSYAGGQIPQLNPVVGLVNSIFSMMTGQNPYDSYRGQNVLTDDQFSAGGWDAMKPFLQWQFRQQGGSIFMNFSTTPKEKSPGEKFLNLPIISNVMGRFVKISSQGETESLREIKYEIHKEGAKIRIEKTNLVNKYVKQFLSTPVEGRKQLEVDIITEYFGHYPPANRDEIAEGKRLLQKYRIAQLRGQNNAKVDAIIYSQTNNEKIKLLTEYKKDMSKKDFIDFLSMLGKHKVISREVYMKVK